MAYIISIETATPVCSVALHRDGELLALRESDDQRKHAENITVFVDEVVKEANIPIQDINAIAISKGPGSYTGLRIGVSAAKGLCYGLSIPLIAINTLEGMLYHPSLSAYAQESILYCPMLDARRMEVYCSLFNTQKEVVQETEAMVIDELSFKKELDKQPVVFFGSGADKCKQTIVHPNAFFNADVIPSAKTIGKMAYQKYQQQQFEDVAYFEPFYLKEFVATVSKK